MDITTRRSMHAVIPSLPFLVHIGRLVSLRRLIPTVRVVMLLQACGSRPMEKHYAQIFFEQQCKHAGPQIHRRIENVEGIMLLRLRHPEGDAAWSDKDFSGAALAHEVRDDEYILKFLAYEHSFTRLAPVSPQSRGYITPEIHGNNVSNVQGYHYVEAIDPTDGVRYRYTMSRRPIPGAKNRATRAVLDKRSSQSKAPRYGVTYEYPSTSQARAFGVASVTIKVIDTKTSEVLGEYVLHVKGVGFDRPDASLSSPLAERRQMFHPDGGHARPDPSIRRYVPGVHQGVELNADSNVASFQDYLNCTTLWMAEEDSPFKPIYQSRLARVHSEHSRRFQ